MSPARLLEHFDRLIDTPDAIPRLRRFILDLAVRGKLVEQDLKDEPAGELLKRIEAEKNRLVKVGQIRNRKEDFNDVEDGQPFSIPKNWSWASFGQLVEFSAGRTPSRHDSSYWNTGDYPWVSISDMKDGDTLLATKETISERAKIGIFKGDPLPVGTMLMSFKLTIGKVSRLGIAAFHNEAIISVFPHLQELDPFLYSFLSLFSQSGVKKDAIKGATLNRESLARLPIPLPPLAEQHRIVAKVDEVMAMCDELEVAQTKREKRRDRLVTATLHGLNNGDATSAPGASTTFEESARFYFNHLPRLTTRPEHIHQLRQTILNLAVRGKLLPQSPKDEPAARLLLRIAAARKHPLINDATGARSAGSHPRVDMTVPNGWQAVQFQAVLLELQTGPFGSSLHQQDYEIGGTPVINPASIQDGRIVPIAKMAVGQETLARLATFKLRKNDVVMGRRGEMGRCAVVTEKEEGWLCGTGSLVLRFTDEISPWFIVKMMSSPSIREYLGGASVGATMQNLNQSIMNEMPMGLPPLAEQRRIVAKIDELMRLCDEQEAGIATTTATNEQFILATIAEALRARSAMAS